MLSAIGDVFIIENPFGLISFFEVDASVSKVTNNIQVCRPHRGQIFIEEEASWWHDPEGVESKMLNLHVLVII